MTEPTDRFAAETPKLEDARRGECSDYLHEYTGVLADTSESVRVYTPAPALAGNEDVVDAFTRVSDQWANAAANATIVSVRHRDDTPRPWIAVPAEPGAALEAVQSELSPAAIGSVVSETADALRTLGLYNTVHGHLSPSDVYVSATGDEPSVQIGGFGLEAAIRTAVGEYEPTPYTAPELRAEPGQPTERSDVYGLGAVTYFALTGRAPDGDADAGVAPSPPSEYVDTVPPALDEAVLRALSEQPADRQASPYVFSRAFLGSFDPDSGETDDEVTERGSEAAATAATDTDARPDEGGDSPTAEAEQAASDDDDTALTRRAAVGLVGLTGIGGGAWLVTSMPGSESSDTQSGDGVAPDAPAPSTATPEANTAADAGAETPASPATETPTATAESSDRDPSAEFGENVYVIARGETASITVEFDATSVATLQIGTIEDDGYAVVAELEDGDRDGVATVEFDSYLAANGTPSDTLRAGPDTVVSAVDTADGSFEGNQPAGSDLLDATDYRMSVASGPKTSPTVDDPDAIATLVLSEG
ncbi:protein kinase [Haloarcula onubensis]|uniref:non-specific serine/threonine protein kinase n=1 Tax=Haloarcula onubensis TaxID=2950539 RepID=A0ABU2FWV8_9EURY|nr:protein kinase [Halomicroarcula sp. S3CR25-11]MDS0284631.1 hypothetical protein [Halomicroarcula sp. S3CR25-11]